MLSILGAPGVRRAGPQRGRVLKSHAPIDLPQGGKGEGLTGPTSFCRQAYCRLSGVLLMISGQFSSALTRLPGMSRPQATDTSWLTLR